MKIQFVKASSFALTGVLALASSCAGAKGDASQKPAETPAKAEASQPATRPEVAAPAKAHPVLDAYGKVHAHLVADKVAEAVAAAKLLADAANQAAASAGDAQKKAFTDIESAATTMAKADVSAADEVRKHFGEVSKTVIALLIAEPSLAAGHHTFRCDMAQGFPKWVQASANLQNPYMGQRMPKCGSKSELSL